uniref:Poly [ADP-ribose] polymerase n=2 Tax=Haemonchus placei TaxID=6290 RepID=A0A158QL91_HAEPC
LPERILGVSVLKKGYNNANITPLHTAAINPNVKILERLRTIEPNINIPDLNNWYTIHYAAVCEGPEPLKFLLKNGASPMALTKQHESPLHVAARAGRKENIKILLDAITNLEAPEKGTQGIKPEKSMINARTRHGDTALCFAVRYQRTEAVATLLAHETVLVDHPTSSGQNKITPLMIACSLGFLSIAELLIEHGALIMARDLKKRTALSHAVLNGQEHCAAMLLAKGADLLKGDSSGNTPAHYAAAYGWLECLRLLASVDPSCLKQENDWKLTPLSIAYLKGHYGIVRWLLEEKASLVDINGKDMEGVTLLSSLLRYTNEDTHSELPEQIQYLLSRGADCSVADSLGNSIMHVFAGIKIRLRDPKDVRKEGMTEKEYRSCFDSIMKCGGNVESKNESGETPLHIALLSANLLLFRWMLEYVDDIRAVLVDTWSSDFTLLHVLLELPMKVWSNNSLWLEESPPSMHLYDKHCNGEIEVWLRQTNSNGLQPILYAAEAYSKLDKPLHCQSDEAQNFVDYVNRLFMWGCDLCPDCLTMKSEPKKAGLDESFSDRSPATTLPYIALNIRLEDGSLRLLRQILEKAVQKNVLRNVLALEGQGGFGLVISALKRDPSAARLILQTTKQYGCVDGVHNAVLRYETKPKEGEEGKPVNKSLAMLFVEQKAFDLVYELQLSPTDWEHTDANGDNLWHYVARAQDLRAVDLFRFLESKKIPMKGNNQGYTPLHEAVQSCDCSTNSTLEPIEWLAANTTDIPRDVFGRTPLHYAFASRSQFTKNALTSELRDPIAVVSILTRNMNKQQLDWGDCEGNTALHLAAFKNANICAVTLIRKGASVSIKNKEGNIPLAIAVLHGRQSVALTLIQADSNVTEQVFPPKPKEVEDNVWKWKGVLDTKEEPSVSTIPAQIVAKGGVWEAMVYVLLDTLGTNITSMVQLIDASLKERQYNLANQLLKSLQTRVNGKKLPRTEYNLLLTFADHFRGELSDDGVEHAVLHRLYLLGCEVMNDGVSLPIESAIRRGSWSLYRHFKVRAGKDFASLRPSQPTQGPLRNAVLRLSERCDADSDVVLRELASLPHFSLDEPLSLPLPYELAEASLTSLCPIAWCCALGKDQLVLRLRAAGADVNAPDLEGRTPMMIAVLANKETAVQALCGDGSMSMSKKITPKKTAAHTATRLFLGAINGRKRKASESDGDEEDERAETEEESEAGSERSETESAAEDEAETEKDDTDFSPPKRIQILNRNLDLMVSDRKGRNIVHYMVEPIPWENIELLRKLHKEAPAKIKQLLQQKNKDGNTPLDIAVRTKQRRMASAMKELLGGSAKKAKMSNGGSPHGSPLSNWIMIVHRIEFLSDSSYFNTHNEKFSNTNRDPAFVCTFQVEVECTARFITLSDGAIFAHFFARWHAEHSEVDVSAASKPSALSGYRETADLVICPVTHQYMSAVLNKTDLNYGQYGFHNFYRIELMKRRDTNLWILFTNWGRIGMGRGEFQTTPFSTLDAAMKEFKSVWRSKTGQDWGLFSQFQVLPKKYRLVETVKKISNLSEISFNFVETKEESLTRRTIQDISNVQKLKSYAKEMDRSMLCPFGHISEAAIERARTILNDCEKNVQDLEKILARESHSDGDVLKAFETSRLLSGEFYNVFPIADFEYGAVKIFDNKDEINRARETLNRMTEVEVATRLLTAAAYRKDVDKISYIIAALECRFTEMSPTADMSQKILRYIHTTGGSGWKVKGILQITPRDATLNFADFIGDGNQMFLWHGTKAVNLLSILKDGFLINPRNSSITGRLFGDGIYLADSFEKSTHYCQSSANGYNYMLLCRVALGKCYSLNSWNYNWGDQLPKGYDSLHAVGQKHPSSSITENGVVMPLADFVDRSSRCYGALEFSEYIVRDSNRILPQYLVIYQ